MTDDSKTIFLTGVTGALGSEMIRELLTTTDDRLYLLIRRKGRHSHWDRARKMLADMNLETMLGTRVQVMEGDVTRPDFGLPQYDLDLLVKNVDEFMHIAALTALNGSEKDCFRINLNGTEQALKLAWKFKNEGKLDRFFYFSTAYAAGSLQDYCSTENCLPENPAHANHYEASKYASETKVRNAMADGLRVTIFRPSIVVGHSETGVVTEFNVVYPFMKLFAHGMLSKLPADPENSFNIVPIDFVIRASCEIRKQPDSVGKTYHLVTKNPPAIGTLLKVKEMDYPTLPDIELVDPKSFTPKELKMNEQFVFAMLKPYLGYLTGHLTFDTTNTEAALEGTGVQFPNTDIDFLRVLIKYAVDVGYLVVPS